MKWILLAIVLAIISVPDKLGIREMLGVTGKLVKQEVIDLDLMYQEYVLSMGETPNEVPYLTVRVTGSNDFLWVSDSTRIRRLELNSRQNVVCFDNGSHPEQVIFNATHNKVYVDPEQVTKLKLSTEMGNQKGRVYAEFNKRESNEILPRESTCQSYLRG